MSKKKKLTKKEIMRKEIMEEYENDINYRVRPEITEEEHYKMIQKYIEDCKKDEGH